MRNLVVVLFEPDRDAALAIASLLEAKGCRLRVEVRPHPAVDEVVALRPDIVVVDVDVEDAGLFLRRVRPLTKAAIVVVAEGSTEHDRIALLDDGADHVVPDPGSPPEIAAQVIATSRSLLRRREVANRSVAGRLVADDGSREVRVFGRRVSLTAIEWKLLSVLMTEPGRPFSRVELMEAVWGSSVGAHSTVSAHVRRLRKKIEPDPASPQLVRTVSGLGYSYEPVRAPGDVPDGTPASSEAGAQPGG
ncbi:MAG: response regulator transcription factor [Actinomycetota bacterium]|nr:response regulator transcription factor [Actinomycetota bacterium]